MMTETMGAVTTAAVDKSDDVPMVSSPTPEELATARELVRQAQARGVSWLFRLSRGGAVWHWVALAVIGGCRPTVPGGVDSLVF
jgi:hypothetical protein